jgi:outer membrane murein-binding lipoprotein Lpp
MQGQGAPHGAIAGHFGRVSGRSRTLQLAAVGVTVCALAGCSSSSSTPVTAATPAATIAPTPDSAAPVPIATPTSNDGRNISRTCADVATIKSLNDQFNAPGEGLAQGRTLAKQLKVAADALLGNITDEISSDARTFDAEIGVVNTYVDKAPSVVALGDEAHTNPTLRSALMQVGTAESDLTAWSEVNC